MGEQVGARLKRKNRHKSDEIERVLDKLYQVFNANLYQQGSAVIITGFTSD